MTPDLVLREEPARSSGGPTGTAVDGSWTRVIDVALAGAGRDGAQTWTSSFESRPNAIGSRPSRATSSRAVNASGGAPSRIPPYSSARSTGLTAGTISRM